MDEFIINDYFEDKKAVQKKSFQQKKSEFFEKFAQVWRELGQPNTDDYTVVTKMGTEEDEYAGSHCLGMNVYTMPQELMVYNICVVPKWDIAEHNNISSRFVKLWESDIN